MLFRARRAACAGVAALFVGLPVGLGVRPAPRNKAFLQHGSHLFSSRSGSGLSQVPPEQGHSNGPEIGVTRNGESVVRTYAALREHDTASDRNPYTEDIPLRVMDDMDPVAPESQLGFEGSREASESAGTANKWYSFTKGYGYYVHVPKHMYGHAFPAEWDTGETPQTGARLRCANSPTNFQDKESLGCEHYEVRKYCNLDGTQGAGWDRPEGIDKYVDANGVSARTACCVCGGGASRVVMGQPVEDIDKDREIHAPLDRLPLEYYPLTPRAGREPQSAKDPVAPADWVDDRYRLYFQQLHEHEKHITPHGLTVEFFSVAGQPKDWHAGWSPGTNVDHVRLDPFVDFRSGGGKSWLAYPVKPEPQVWWVKWSGTLETLLPGDYNFNLKLGGALTYSTFIVDGQEILTEGQCTTLASGGETECQDRGCAYTAGGTPTCAAKAPGIVNLAVGGHCIQVFTRMRFSDVNRDVALRYMGPDTNNMMITVPTPVLNCNPAVYGSCSAPELDACNKAPGNAVPAGSGSARGSAAK